MNSPFYPRHETVPQRLRVILVDDHALIRASFRTMLEGTGFVSIVGETSDGTAALAKIQDLSPELALVDVGMPGMNGIELTQRITHAGSSTRVIAVTAHEEPRFILDSLKAGAKGFVPKSAAGVDLITAIRTVARGEYYVHPSVVGAFLKSECQPDSAKSLLSDRETRVLRLIALGHSNKEIAHELQVGVKSVETYKARASKKIKAVSRVDIVKYAILQGWLFPTSSTLVSEDALRNKR